MPPGVIGSASHAGRCDELNEAPWERRRLAGRRYYIAISGQNAYETFHACLLSLLAAETAAFPGLNPPGKHDSHFQLHPMPPDSKLKTAFKVFSQIW